MSRYPTPITRRTFLAASTVLIAGCAQTQRQRIVPRRISANEKVNLGVVGCGGRGGDNLAEMGTANLPINVAALCDCDQRRAAETFKKYPDAKRYTDWRKMLEAEKTLDAVLVATPDHNHAIVSIAAM